MTPQQILDTTASHYGTTTTIIKSKLRGDKYTEARAIICYLLKYHLGMGKHKMAKLVNRCPAYTVRLATRMNKMYDDTSSNAGTLANLTFIREKLK